MNWTTKHTFEPDREAIKMRWEFQMIETDDSYILILNEEDYHIYSKEVYSQLQAECESMDTVNQAKEKHGENNVYYDGFLSTQKQETKKAFGKLTDLSKMAETFFQQVKTI